MQLETIALTHQGLVRTTNQDAILALPEYGFFTVADGMGGEQAGDEASARVVATLESAARDLFSRAPEAPEQIEEALDEALRQANRDVFEISVKEPAKRGLGSTASILCLQRGAYFTSHIGDSRIYLVRDRQIRQLTHDHTLVWMLYERGRIRRDQLERHPERHLLTQCVGIPGSLKIDKACGTLRRGDLFLICSDGLTGYVAEERFFALLDNSGCDLEAQANALLGEALKSGGGDNISVILVRVAGLDPEDDWAAEAEPASAALRPEAPRWVDADAVTVSDDGFETWQAHETRALILRKLLVPGAMISISLLLMLLLWVMKTHH